jgi:Dyp-type peroxidase family
MPLLDHPDLPVIQGDIVPGFRNRDDLDYAQHFLFLQLGDRGRALNDLKALSQHLTTATELVRQPGEPAPTSTNVGFTFAGLRALAPELDLDSVFADHPAFRAGLAARSDEGISIKDEAARFGLLGPSEHWGKAKDAHVVVNLGAPGAETLAGHVLAVKECVSTGFDVLGEQAAAVLDHEQQEAFGFADGLSQPLVEGFHKPRAAPAAPPLPADRFLLAGDDDSITANGSFMVWVRFTQHQDEFDRHCDDVARKLRLSGYREAGTSDVAAALEVGRWPDGTPLGHCPVVGPRHVHDPSEAFDYVQDFFGRRCPRLAHVRKMNPRTAVAGEHAILRRGIPFRDGDEEGLIFVCYQKSIEQQFERLQGYWANAAYEPEANASPDPLISQRARQGCFVEVPLPDGGSVPVEVENTWIRPTDGFYAFVPSLSGLNLLLGVA